MKKSFFLPLLLMLALVGCEDNTKQADTNNDKEENTIPYWWSPVGHKYISTDEDYLNREITFISKDSFLWKREDHQKVYPYRIKYPIIYVLEDEHPWLKFVDTLTISRKSDLADESSCYKLVY